MVLVPALVAALAAAPVSPTAPARLADGYIGVMVKLSTDPEGVQVVAVVEGAPAEKAGLKADDVITRFDGEAVPGTLDEFVSKVREKKPGDEIKFEVVRGKEKNEIKVKVGEKS